MGAPAASNGVSAPGSVPAFAASVRARSDVTLSKGKEDGQGGGRSFPERDGLPVSPPLSGGKMARSSSRFVGSASGERVSRARSEANISDMADGWEEGGGGRGMRQLLLRAKREVETEEEEGRERGENGDGMGEDEGETEDEEEEGGNGYGEEGMQDDTATAVESLANLSAAATASAAAVAAGGSAGMVSAQIGATPPTTMRAAAEVS